ncbi:hypothetical protein L914_00238 [Phytophthora nicotianae]|uniref:RxLR effector protein n=1 Tax=Phytophthora nicotianae TaxID=4792 RepID=W2P874_PHYNI|nr:hypothetical protein L916_13854 [Phytophthora nicotianae]ETM56855.1 hypothetical protein L914_00238 [Phytophthora nicotianae]
MCRFAILVLVVAIVFTGGGTLSTLINAERSTTSKMTDLSSLNNQHERANLRSLRATTFTTKSKLQFFFEGIKHDISKTRKVLTKIPTVIKGKLFYKKWFKEGKTPEDMRAQLGVFERSKNHELYNGYVNYWFKMTNAPKRPKE